MRSREKRFPLLETNPCPPHMNALHHDIVLTPAGRLRLREEEPTETRPSAAWMHKVADAFSSCQAAGLFALAASNPDTPLSPTFAYWRDFASRYLTQLCRTPESAGSRLRGCIECLRTGRTPSHCGERSLAPVRHRGDRGGSRGCSQADSKAVCFIRHQKKKRTIKGSGNKRQTFR